MLFVTGYMTRVARYLEKYKKYDARILRECATEHTKAARENYLRSKRTRLHFQRASAALRLSLVRHLSIWLRSVVSASLPLNSHG
jgi:hypothetical protein